MRAKLLEFNNRPMSFIVVISDHVWQVLSSQNTPLTQTQPPHPPLLYPTPTPLTNTLRTEHTHYTVYDMLHSISFHIIWKVGSD